MPQLTAYPVPSGKEEPWRFAPLAALAPLLDADAGWRDANVEVGGVAASPISHLCALTPVDRPSAIAVERGERVIGIALDGDEPVVTIDVDGGKPSDHLISQVRIDARPGTHGIVVLGHRGGGANLGNVEIKVGEGADVTVVSLQEWSAGAAHAGFHHALVGRDAHYRHIAVTLGGGVVRLVNAVSYAGPGASVELFGVHLTGRGQYHEHRLDVDQNQPQTTSRVDYRGALAGPGAHSVWVGDVHIRRDATGSDSYESNRNLLLSPGGVADSVPNLEIETGNVVRAGHASVTGRFDDEQMFYLQSRGISEAGARRLIVQGFFDDIIARIGLPVLEKRLRIRVNAKLDHSQEG